MLKFFNTIFYLKITKNWACIREGVTLNLSKVVFPILNSVSQIPRIRTIREKMIHLLSHIFPTCPVYWGHLLFQLFKKFVSITKSHMISRNTRMNRTYPVPASWNLDSNREYRKGARHYERMLRNALMV